MQTCGIRRIFSVRLTLLIVGAVSVGTWLRARKTSNGGVLWTANVNAAGG